MILRVNNCRFPSNDKNRIIVAHDISPADALKFKNSNNIAFVTDIGGTTSHTAILAKSINIPSVVGTQNAKNLISNGDNLIVDGDHGCVIINPTDEDLYLARYRIYVTADGKEFFLLDKAENTPVFAGDDNPMDLKLSVNPLTSIGLAFKKFKGKPIDYDFEGYIWLDYRGLEIPIPVKGHKRIAL